MNGAAAVRGRFVGGRATGYEERRAHRDFWAKEHAAVHGMLADLPRGSRVLDIPVGTGRYASIYQALGLDAIGIDISPDMLSVAAVRVRVLGFVMDLREGDVLAIDAPDKSFDAVVCTRLLNWLLPEEMARAIAEMARVTTRRMIVSIQIGARASDKGNKAQTHSSVDAAIRAVGWAIEKRIEISPNYWMLEMRPT